jgi:AraC-like DNA-binding protein
VVDSTYLKSGIPPDEMEAYAQKVNDYLVSKKYLDSNFNLNILSSDLKIPKHYLSQVFSQYYGKNFLKYINSLRIMHACELLEDHNLESTIEGLAEHCGFSSKASFYRNFKEIAKMTPSEFINRAKTESEY